MTLVAGAFFAEERTDAQGAFAFAGLAEGDYTLGASARDLEYAATEVAFVATGTEGEVLSLGPETEGGTWASIGDTSPETFGGTNSGVLLTDGRVIFCHDTEEPVVFDPVSLVKTFPEQPPEIESSEAAEQGCHHVSYLSDGRTVYVGGGTVDDQGNFTGSEFAVPWVKAFDPVTESWERFPDLNEPRWYPGLVALPHGALLAFGGGQQNTSYDLLRTATSETFDAATLTWTPAGDLGKVGGFGPAVTLFDGRVLMTWDPVQVYDPATRTWQSVANFLQPDRGDPYGPPDSAEPAVGDHPDHSIVLLPDGRVAAIGIWATAMGAGASGSMTEVYDPDQDVWSLGASPEIIRAHPEVLQLPDGRIFVAGGHYEGGGVPVQLNEWDYVDSTDLYDPELDVYRAVTPMLLPREYHAITLLLPDGRVLVTAGEAEPGQNPADVAQIDVFTPPYLLRGPRPVIESVSTTELVRGTTVELDVSNTDAPTGIVLVGASAITHFLDGGTERLLRLDFTQSGSTITATIPDDANVALAGWYLLFAMVDDVPSEGRMVHVAP